MSCSRDFVYFLPQGCSSIFAVLIGPAAQLNDIVEALSKRHMTRAVQLCAFHDHAVSAASMMLQQTLMLLRSQALQHWNDRL